MVRARVPTIAKAYDSWLCCVCVFAMKHVRLSMDTQLVLNASAFRGYLRAGNI